MPHLILSRHRLTHFHHLNILRNDVIINNDVLWKKFLRGVAAVEHKFGLWKFQNSIARNWFKSSVWEFVNALPRYRTLSPRSMKREKLFPSNFSRFFLRGVPQLRQLPLRVEGPRGCTCWAANKLKSNIHVRIIVASWKRSKWMQFEFHIGTCSKISLKDDLVIWLKGRTALG